MHTDREKLYEGKAKIVFSGDSKDTCVQFFKDSATAFNGEKKDQFEGKGQLNCQISCKIFEILKKSKIPSHFVRQIDERSMEIFKLEMIPVEVIVRNRVAGSLAKKLPSFSGKELQRPLVEFCLKDDALQDPPLSEDVLELVIGIKPKDLEDMKKSALEINQILQKYFQSKSLILVDFKLEFGKKDGKILLADEISPDTCRLWDEKTGEKLDKDRYRYSLGDLLQGYREIWKRMSAE